MLQTKRVISGIPRCTALFLCHSVAHTYIHTTSHITTPDIQIAGDACAVSYILSQSTNRSAKQTVNHVLDIMADHESHLNKEFE